MSWDITHLCKTFRHGFQPVPMLQILYILPVKVTLSHFKFKFLHFRRNRDVNCGKMPVRKYRNDTSEVSCCLKYVIFGFNVLFWVSNIHKEKLFPSMTNEKPRCSKKVSRCFVNNVPFKYVMVAVKMQE